MSQYLQFRCGPYRLLVPIEAVVEIGAADAADSGGRRAWRGGTLPVVDLAGFLGLSRAPRAQQLVLGEAAALHLLDVDQVDGLVELPGAGFATLADLSPPLAALVDAAVPAPDGAACLLRLRQPFAWQPPRDDATGRAAHG